MSTLERWENPSIAFSFQLPCDKDNQALFHASHHTAGIGIDHTAAGIRINHSNQILVMTTQILYMTTQTLKFETQGKRSVWFQLCHHKEMFRSLA